MKTRGAEYDAGSQAQHERGIRARRYNRALVSIARHVWSEGCTFESAIETICETAAQALEVERVKLWRYNVDGGVRVCIHTYVRSSDAHNPACNDKQLHMAEECALLLDEVRAIHIDDVTSNEMTADSKLQAYLQRHSVQSLLAVPVRSEGELLGVVCHEHIADAREWMPEDGAFAGSVGDFIAIAYEMESRRELEARMRFLKTHDPQTLLPNRDHLLEVVHAVLNPPRESNKGLVAIHLRVDAPAGALTTNIQGFHTFLMACAEQLRELTLDNAALARVRENAFAIIPYRQQSEDEVLALAERCIDLIQASATGSEGYLASVTAGIAFSRDLAASSADALLRNAESASLRAQSQGQGRCIIFRADRHRKLLARMHTEQALREAYVDGCLLVYYMPEIGLHDGRWRSAEALLRWRKDDGQIVAAGEFIDVAESSGLIVKLGRWVLLEACSAAARWPERDGMAPLLRVNVSARQFEEPSLIADIESALRESSLPPDRLCLELTETMLLRDPDSVSGMLTRLRAIGIRVALDDFGTGYCSLGYLKRLPIDAIKIDRGFTAGLPGNQIDLAIIQAVVGLADKLGIGVVAEGVETEEQAHCLRESGVIAGQGYLYSPAIENEALIAQFGDRV